MPIKGKGPNSYSLGSRRRSRVRKRGTLKEVSTLGLKGINMLEVDLSRLLSRKTFTVLYTLFRNRYKVRTITLVNSRANAFALLNTKYAKKIFKFINMLLKTLKKPVLVKGYDR